MTSSPIEIDPAMFDGQLELASSALDDCLAALPARRGLALLLAEGGRPVLLLPAADLRARVAGRLKNPDEQERRRLPDLQAVTRRILWRLAWSHFESDLRFLEISRSLWPDTYSEMLAWKPAWFLRVDLGADYPFFARTQDVVVRGEGETPMPQTGQPPAPSVRHFGPFPSGAAAQKFIDGLADAFDLCREVRCLRQAPHGRRCSYGQMGKCLCPCDGSINSGDYRRVVTEATEFVAGARRPLVEKLQLEMKQAAAELQFERAGAVRSKLARLAELEAPGYAFVAPAEEFRFLLIQRGEGRREKKLSSFLADCAAIRPAGPLEYPLKPPQLQKLVDLATAVDSARPRLPHAAERSSSITADRWAMGLVTHYLFAGDRRRGLILSLRTGLTADHLAAQIENSAEALGLRKGPLKIGT